MRAKGNVSCQLENAMRGPETEPGDGPISSLIEGDSEQFPPYYSKDPRHLCST